MIFEQIYLGCLAQASYLIGSRGDAAVVDPRRDVDDYITAARRHGLTIRYVIETHLHADFVSGHAELAARTGASIVIGAEANAEFPHLPVSDGDVVPLGDLTLRMLGTPGHTPESICILIEEAGKPLKVLTGDTLFIGDVGRPDLAGGAGFTPAEMAALLYDSLHGKLMALPDDVEVWPAHGAGSLCGRNMSKETSSTIGLQRRTNYALRPMSREEFVVMMTDEMVEAPGYFFRDAQINRRGAPPLGDVPPPRPMSPREAVDAVARGVTVLDVRSPAAFGTAHVPRSLNVGLGGQYASWAGTMIAPEAELVLVADGDDGIREAAMRLTRVGLENARAYISGGITAWCDAALPLASVPQISVDDLQKMMQADPNLQVVDVRRTGEYRAGHVPGAVNIPLHELPGAGTRLDALRPVVVICASGYRSSIGTSVLERLGFTELYNVTGGTNAWLVSGLPAEKVAWR